VSDPARQTLRDLAAAYALGALDAEEAAVFEREVANSPDLAREVAAYREVAALLGLAAPPAHLDPALKGRLLERVARPQARPVVRRGRWPERLAWAAALAGLVASGVFGLKARGAGRYAARLEAELARTRSVLAERETSLHTILGPGTVAFTLSRTGARQPSAQGYWNRGANRWVLYVTSLQPAPRGRAYQLWFLHGNKATPSVTFNSEPAGTALLSLPGPAEVAGLTAAAITEEPEGGSPQPTSAPILVGLIKPLQ
jgi:anti-sigma-K factor RskA